MRSFVFVVSLLVCGSYAHAYQFIFTNGKSLEGSILYEDGSTYRILSSGIEMRIRKSELNVAATQAANVITETPVPEPPIDAAQSADVPPARHSARVYSNVDVQGANPVASAPADRNSEKAWRAHINKLEREFSRLQGECRAAGTGPNFSKVRRTETYRINGRSVRVTGYWADPVNIEAAKNICRRALQTEKALNDARLQFSEFQAEQQSSGGR